MQCIAGHNMVFLSKDYNMGSYRKTKSSVNEVKIFGCPILNEKAKRKLEHMGAECSPNSEIGRIYRVKSALSFFTGKIHNSVTVSIFFIPCGQR